MTELSLATRIPFSTWLTEPDDVIATVLDIFEERAKAAKQSTSSRRR